MIRLSLLNEYRSRPTETRFGLNLVGESDDHFGCFLVKTKGHPKPLKIIASRFREDFPEHELANPPWNHVSVSLPNRTPTWAEMSFVKDLFFEPHEVVMQLHVGEGDHISNHEFCLHLWQPVRVAIPTPPSSMVGIKSLGTVPHRKK